MKPRVLELCTGMGLMGRAFADAGFEVVPGCEIDPDQRELHGALHPEAGQLLCHDIADLADAVRGQEFCGLIGGPACQSFTKLKAIRTPKYPDLTPFVREVLAACTWSFYLFENVARLNLEGARHVRLNAMHYYQPHQSRARWFTYQGIEAPKPAYKGTVDDLMAYSVVAGRIYGPKRGARLQGYPAVAELPFPCVQLQKGLANAVPYPLALAWAEEAMKSLVPQP